MQCVKPDWEQVDFGTTLQKSRIVYRISNLQYDERHVGLLFIAETCNAFVVRSPPLQLPPSALFRTDYAPAPPVPAPLELPPCPVPLPCPAAVIFAWILASVSPWLRRRSRLRRSALLVRASSFGKRRLNSVATWRWVQVGFAP